jgi:5-methylcytosine-specific restriction endonuclease McrA
VSELLEQRKARVRAEWLAQCAKVRVGRKIPEWKGATADTPIPDKVRDRVTLTFENRCYLSTILITTTRPEMEHVIPLSEGGDNHEYNLRPVLPKEHKIKSAVETKRRAKADAARRAKLGLKTKQGPPMQGAGFTPAAPQRKASKIEPGSKLAQLRALREANAR